MRLSRIPKTSTLCRTICNTTTPWRPTRVSIFTARKPRISMLPGKTRGSQGSPRKTQTPSGQNVGSQPTTIVRTCTSQKSRMKSLRDTSAGMGTSDRSNLTAIPHSHSATRNPASKSSKFLRKKKSRGWPTPRKFLGTPSQLSETRACELLWTTSLRRIPTS
jgi:hypothetical protein